MKTILQYTYEHIKVAFKTILELLVFFTFWGLVTVLSIVGIGSLVQLLGGVFGGVVGITLVIIELCFIAAVFKWANHGN